MALSDLSRSRAAKLLVLLLVVLAVATTVGLYVDRGLRALPEGLIFLYISLVLAYGVVRERLETPPVQTAFGLGIAAYGTAVYLTEGGWLWIGLAVVAALLAGRNLLYLRE